ncbi:hypothetical protein Tco_0891429 [Tanacetum coccineum]|uniref:Uncharacterized protein n=1 Tax=Tanacetum coccineum TaxID=301880 RepID=A0ABQ5C624_9ASTR
MYLIAFRPYIMFAVCACARFQVSPKTSHLLAVKRIFRYLKGKLSLGLWYSKDSPLELVAYTDSDYAGATQDRKSTIGGCQFLGNRLISWQCKKQTVVATSTTKVEYVAAASCCGQNTLRYAEGNNFNKHSRHIRTPLLASKFFNKIRGQQSDNTGQEVALFPTMLNVSEPSTSPSRITSSTSPSPESSPSHSPEPLTEHSPNHTTAAVSFPSPIQPTQPSPETEQHIPTPYDSPLYVVHSHGSDEGSLKLIELTNLVTKLSERIDILEDDLKQTKLTYSAAVTKLILRVKKLEFQVKTGKARKRARVVLSKDDKDVEDDSSKQGRKSDAEVQGKASIETEPIIQEVTPTESYKNQGTERKEISEVSTEEQQKGLLVRRRSEEERTRKDKGKAIMTESEPKKKSKKEIEQERLSIAEAIRLQEQMNEDQRAQIARDEEIARQ